MVTPVHQSRHSKGSYALSRFHFISCFMMKKIPQDAKLALGIVCLPRIGRATETAHISLRNYVVLLVGWLRVTGSSFVGWRKKWHAGRVPRVTHPDIFVLSRAHLRT